jgi:hypothetical protein
LFAYSCAFSVSCRPFGLQARSPSLVVSEAIIELLRSRPVAAGSGSRLASATADVAFRTTNNVGTPDEIISWLNSPACTCPC